MKYFIILFFSSSLLFSKIYYSKVEPYEVRNISSNVVGLVLSIDENMIGKKLTSRPYITIDSELDRKELQSINRKLLSLNNIIQTNKKVLKNLETLVERKKINYDKIKSLKIKSVVEKDREFYDLVTSENLLLTTMKEIENLNIQVADFKLRQAHLKRSIVDKNLNATGFVLYSIDVRPGQVVSMATPLAKIADISKAKLSIFLDEVDVINAQTKKVYIDGVATEYKVSRILTVADSKNISKYMAQIIINPPKVFSKLVKIELK